MRKKPKAKYSAKRDGDRAVFDIVCDLVSRKTETSLSGFMIKVISVKKQLKAISWHLSLH